MPYGSEHAAGGGGARRPGDAYAGGHFALGHAVPAPPILLEPELRAEEGAPYGGMSLDTAALAQVRAAGR
jgi:hypothetical protein